MQVKVWYREIANMPILDLGRCLVVTIASSLNRALHHSSGDTAS